MNYYILQEGAMRIGKVIGIFIILFAFIILFQSCKKSESSTGPNDQTVTLGTLTISPTGVIVNTYTTLIIRLNVPAGIQLSDSLVQVVKLDANGNSTGTIGELADNGNLYNADEIMGDNIYSGKVTINESQAGTITLAAQAKIKSGDQIVDKQSETASIQVYTQLTSGELNDVLNTQSNAATQLNQYLAGNVQNLDNAMSQLTTWLNSKAEVQSATLSGSTSIDIQYKNGLNGEIIVSVEDASGGVTRGGSVVGSDERRSKKSIPLSKQTVGTTITPSNMIRKVSNYTSEPDPKLIGNRNVLIYAPFEAAFAPNNEGPGVKSILQDSSSGFEIDYYSNQNATVAVLNNLTNYGLVILATHGSGGNSFLTGEIVDTNATAYKDSYKALLKANKLKISLNLVIANNGGVKTRANVYGVKAAFISDIAGTFPNSVILNNSCESTKSADLQNAFIGKGAKTYYGYDKIVSSGFCVTNADTLVKRLAKDMKTTGESFMAGSDPGSHHATFQIKGENDIRYPDDLINGDFEFGKLQGWTKSGDGRVISKLGSQSPTGGKYMGIISTGLGYTTTTGKIFQTFTIRQNQSSLTVKWNFLSEEFLEYINSSYMDYYTITIKEADGTETELLRKNIDDIASDFGAQKFNKQPDEVPQPGDLVYVSPGIVFDKGDVYMTGWQTDIFNVSAFKGKRITLILAAGDVGDSIYDTAILLDDITVQ